MPSNRAILRDISDMGLDPAVAYTRTASNGRLGHRSDDSGVTVVHETKHVKEPTKVVEVVKPIVDVTKSQSLPKPEVKVEKVVNDGVVEEKVEVSVGNLKIEVEVPVVSDVSSNEVEEKVDESAPKADEDLPEIPAGEDVLVLASSKKIKAKKAVKPVV